MKSKSSLKKEIYIGIVAVLIFVIYFGLTFTIVQKGSLVGMSINSIAPSFLPRIIGVLGIIVGFSILIPAIIRYIKASPEIKEEDSQPKVPFLTKDRIIILASLSVYLLAMETLGYIISSFLVSFGLLTFFERKKIIKNFIFSLVFVSACFYIFNNVLQIWLPLGIFFE